MEGTSSNIGEARRAAPIFVTSNDNKRREAQEILGIELAMASPDVPEVQDTDFETVAKAKALAARKALGNPEAPVLVDDSGIAVEAWNGFPGALTKWLIQSVGNRGLLRMLFSERNRSATAVCAVVVADVDGNTLVFRGEVPGTITTEPRGEGGFGYDPVFQPDGQPDGQGRTYAEMGAEKSGDSHRARAFLKLRKYLEKHLESDSR